MLYLKQCAAYDQPHCPAVLASQECQLHSVALILDRIIIGTDHLHAFCYIKILIALFIRQLDDISLFQGFQVRKISSMSAPIVTCKDTVSDFSYTCCVRNMPDTAGKLITSGSLQYRILDVKCLNLYQTDYFLFGKCGSIFFTNGGFECRLPMILFFFMVSTTMRDQELLVRYKLPEATEVQKLEKKSLVSYIHIGQPSLAMQAKFGTAPRIQLNDSYKTTKDILDFVAAERDKLSEADRASMTICLKADQTTKMGIVTDVKQELRRANALKVSYAASKSLGY